MKDRGEVQELLDIREKRREGLIAYLRLKVDEEDWHGAADACMDLREVDAQIAVLEEWRADAFTV